MRFLTRTLLAITILGSLMVLLISVWPGLLGDVLFWVFLLSVIWFPIVVIIGIIIAVFLFRRRRQGELTPIPKLEALAIPVVAFFAICMVIFYVPCKIGFLLSYSDFKQTLADTKPNAYSSEKMDKWLGIYKVDEYGTDSRGGVYYRVYSGMDGIGPDTMSYGFVYRPNKQGTPFGAAKYNILHVLDDWYLFAASSDWY